MADTELFLSKSASGSYWVRSHLTRGLMLHGLSVFGRSQQQSVFELRFDSGNLISVKTDKTHEQTEPVNTQI